MIGTLAFSLLLVPTTVRASVASGTSLIASTMAATSGALAITVTSNVYVLSGHNVSLGPAGSVNIASNVFAGAYFGNGTHLSGIGVLSATQAFSGAAIFTSSFGVVSDGRQVTLSTSASSMNITLSSTGVITFFPELHNSSTTEIPSTLTTNASLGPCIQGSTLTIKTNGGRVEVGFTGSILSASAYWTQCGLSILEDGRFLSGLSAVLPVYYTGDHELGYSNYSVSGTFSYLIDPPSPGPHSYCLTLAQLGSSGGSWGCKVVNNDDSASLEQSRTLFFVKELR